MVCPTLEIVERVSCRSTARANCNRKSSDILKRLVDLQAFWLIEVGRKPENFNVKPENFNVKPE